jgi:NAD(P)-dependent dehydrogenase (short-subunit alcohol dehydrogenase family)
MNFTDRIAMVTGASGNVGRAVAFAFAEAGASLILVDRHPENLVKTFGPEGERRLYLPTDLVDAEQVTAGIDIAIERYGRIDILCNITGGFRMGPAVHESTDAEWNFMLDVNVRTLLNVVRLVVPHMLDAGGGKIVNVGAFSAQKGVAQMAAYCAAKSAVIRITESMAAELREKNINVNCVLPTIIDTPENRAAMPHAEPARWVAPQDLASVILFLSSQAARAIHGAAVPVTGLS